MTPGLKLSTILYASGLAVVSAAMLSLLPALRATRARVQSHLANRGTGGATLRFGRVWTGAMIVQVALTAIGIPVAMESASQAMRKLNIRAAFPSREYLAARIDVDRPFEEETTSAFEARRARTFAELQRRIAQEPGVVAVTFADRAPGSVAERHESERSRSSPAPSRRTKIGFGRRRWARDSSRRSIVRLSPGVPSTRATGVPVRERSSSMRRSRASFHESAGRGSPIGARLRYSASSARSDASAAEVTPLMNRGPVVRDRRRRARLRPGP